MNGRIYDAKLGRFLQADPFIQAPYDTQSLNRYAYTRNNPLNAVDPTGYFFSLIVGIITAIIQVDLTLTVIAVGLAAFAEAMVMGGSFGDALLAGLSAGALTFSGINLFPGFEAGIGKMLLYGAQMGVIGGITSAIQGGKFGHGFISAGFGSFVGAKVGNFVKGANTALTNMGKFLAKVTVGGTISKVTGGKFGNGAGYAAFVSLVASAAQSSTVERSGSNQTSNAPLVERQAAARKEVAALTTDGTLDTNKVFTGDNALANAATEVLDAVHPISERHNVEIGGRLVADGEGVSYGAPVVGTEGSVRINARGAIGAYHTHPGGAAYSIFSNQHTNSGRGGDAGFVERYNIPLFMSNQVDGQINISVCSPGSARCRTDFDPRLYGIDRGISGTPVR